MKTAKLILFFLLFTPFLNPHQAFSRWIPVAPNKQNFSEDDIPNKLFNHYNAPDNGTLIVDINAIDLKKKNLLIFNQHPHQNKNQNAKALNYFYFDLFPSNSYTQTVGLPQIPVITQWIEFNKSVKEIEISLDETNEIAQLNVPTISPVQNSVCKTRECEKSALFSINEKFYQSDEFYPNKRFEIVTTTSIRGRNLALVVFYPVQYNPKKGQIKIFSRFKAQINLKSKIGERRESSHIFNSFFKNYVSNYKNKTNTNSNFKDTILIVVGNNFASNPIIKKLVDLKKSLGFNVLLKRMDEIGQTDQDLRNYIKQSYQLTTPQLAYVLLIGDVEFVPTHAGVFNTGYESWPFNSSDLKNKSSYRGQATDHFYRAIDQDSYEQDIGGPDLMVGRLPIKTTEELELVIGKIIKYQSCHFEQDTHWAKKSSFLATDDRWQIAEATHNFVMENFTSRWGHLGNFPQEQTIGGDKLYAVTHKAKTVNLQKMFDEGRTLINYSGHGGYDLWAAPAFNHSDIKKMAHTEALPFVISNACITNSFARSSDSFGEMWLKAPHGAIAFWGASNNSYWDEDDFLERKLYESFDQHPIKSFGHTTNFALTSLFEHYHGQKYAKYYMEIYNITGDPSIELLTDTPRPLQIISANEFLHGTGGINIDLTDESGKAIANAYVTLISESGLSRSLPTDNLGHVMIPLGEEEINVGETLTLTASHHNFKPTTKKIIVIPSQQSYISLQNFKIVDHENGKVNPNEPFSLQVTYKNVGKNPTGKILAKITSHHPQVIVTKELIHFESLNSGESLQVGDLFNLESKSPLSNQENLSFSISWENEFDHSTGTSYINILSNAPQLTLLNEQKSSDLGGNNNGVIEAGEYGSIKLKIKNSGSYKLKSSLIKAISLSQGIHIDESCIPLRDLEIGEEAEIEIFITVDSAVQNGTIARLELKIEHEGGVQNFSFEQLIGNLINKTFISQTTLPIAIPENSQGVIAEINVPLDMKIDDIKVKVQITHTFIGDLILELISPEGQIVKLHNRKGGSTDNLHCTYGEDCVPDQPFLPMLKEMPKGVWKLRVFDSGYGDIGTLDDLSITLSGHILI